MSNYKTPVRREMGNTEARVVNDGPDAIGIIRTGFSSYTRSFKTHAEANDWILRGLLRSLSPAQIVSYFQKYPQDQSNFTR